MLSDIMLLMKSGSEVFMAFDLLGLPIKGVPRLGLVVYPCQQSAGDLRLGQVMVKVESTRC